MLSKQRWFVPNTLVDSIHADDTLSSRQAGSPYSAHKRASVSLSLIREGEKTVLRNPFGTLLDDGEVLKLRTWNLPYRLYLFVLRTRSLSL